jgi:fructose/tagatose bisphosphate aldolase
MTNRPIIVHGLEDAKTAIAVAAQLGCPVTLRSAPGAAAYLGPQVFRDMIAEARSGQKATNVRVIFDCGDDPGLALSALRHGLKTILIDAPRETFDKITDIAAQTDARVETAQPDGTKTLDLLDLDDAQDAITTWLSGD